MNGIPMTTVFLNFNNQTRLQPVGIFRSFLDLTVLSSRVATNYGKSPATIWPQIVGVNPSVEGITSRRLIDTLKAWRIRACP
jgi:hypothetical protein